MYLQKWCELTKTSNRGLAKKLGGVTAVSVNRWAKVKIFPKPKYLIAIAALTEDMVTANDFVQQWKEVHGQKEI